MKPIAFKKLRSTKKNPKHYFAYQAPFYFEGNNLLDKDGYIVAQFRDNEYFRMNGKAYNLAEALAVGICRLMQWRNIDEYTTFKEQKKAYEEYKSKVIMSNNNPFIAQEEMLSFGMWLGSKVGEV